MSTGNHITTLTEREIECEKWVEYANNYQGVFEVSNFGRIRRNGVVRYKKPDHRKYVSVKRNGKSMKLHQLVWDNFGNKKREYPFVINHIDANPSNNHIDNLELVTQKDNVIHAFKTVHIRRYSGEKNHKSVLSDMQLLEIRKIGNSLPKKKIAEKYGVSRITISRILMGRRNTSTEPVVRYNHQDKKVS